MTVQQLMAETAVIGGIFGGCVVWAAQIAAHGLVVLAQRISDRIDRQRRIEAARAAADLRRARDLAKEI